MKRKITAVLLCVALLLTLPLNVSAAECLQAETSHETKNISVTNEIVVNVDEINDEIIVEPNCDIGGNAFPAATAATPIGYLDMVSSSAIGGWAYRSDIPNSPIEIHIYITNNSTSEQTVYTTVANKYRSDLEAAGYGNGYHAFHFEMSWLRFKPGTYTIRAYAIGANGNNPQLRSSPKTFTVRPMYGGVDGVGNHITGWVWKPDAPNHSVEAHVYIYRPNGQQVFVLGVGATRYRADVEAAGYGTGKYGFACPVNWSALPEERLNIKVYAVDHSGTHPLIYNGYYDNRMPITLLGMVDEEDYDHSTWMWNDDVVSYCENIGCSQLQRYNYADATSSTHSYSQFIKESSYCAIATHGNKYGIQWSMKDIYYGNNHEFGWYTIDHLSELSNNYFEKTRCVVLLACSTASGGKTDSTNFVNVLHSKGVRTVVGFQEPTYSHVNKATKKVYTNGGSQKWLIEFTKCLSEGYNVTEAKCEAYDKTITANLQICNYSKYEFDNDLIPEPQKTELILCGLNSCCIIGDEQQIVKH